MRVALIVAMGENRVIGRAGALPWRLPEDLKHFKSLTMGKPIIMGRKTFRSIGRALPGRANIVVTRDRAFGADGVDVVHSLDDALATARDAAGALGADEIMVIGGAEIYAGALGRAGRVYLTEVHAAPDGDAFFPMFDPAEWTETSRKRHPGAGADGPAYSFVQLDRN